MAKLKINLRDFNKRTKRIVNNVSSKVAVPALDKTARRVVRDAKAITPVDTGDLKNSLTHEVEGGPVATAVMGSDVEYSLIVHEDLSATHVTGQSKFLEKALRKNIKTLQTNIKQAMRRLR